jgi:hypothetical protein
MAVYTVAPTTHTEGSGMEPKKVKTSIVMEDDLLQRLKHAAVEERTDVSSLLARLARAYLKPRKRSRT